MGSPRDEALSRALDHPEVGLRSGQLPLVVTWNVREVPDRSDSEPKLSARTLARQAAEERATRVQSAPVEGSETSDDDLFS